MRSQAFGVALLAITLLASGDVRAQEIRATTVTLTVTDPAGAPIANAHTLAMYGNQFAVVSTDERGHVSFKMLLGGSALIPVSAHGYKSEHVPIDLTLAGDKANATKNVTVVLEPDDPGLQTPQIVERSPICSALCPRLANRTVRVRPGCATLNFLYRTGIKTVCRANSVI